MAIPAKIGFLEATPRSIHVHFKIIAAKTGGSYIVSKIQSALHNFVTPPLTSKIPFSLES